jgi:hypothetical protein
LGELQRREVELPDNDAARGGGLCDFLVMPQDDLVRGDKLFIQAAHHWRGGEDHAREGLYAGALTYMLY